MSDRRPTVIVADDHPLVLEALRGLLTTTFEVVAAVTGGEALLEAAARQQPDLVVTDISMPTVDGIEATRRLASLSPTTRVIVLSFHDEVFWVRAAFEAGAWGYLTKTAVAKEIEGALREVLAGRFYVSPAVTRGFVLPMRTVPEVVRQPIPVGEKALTPREKVVVRLVGQGLPNKEIASELGVSITTIRTHLKSVYSKLGRGSRVELALYAAQGLKAAS